MNRRLALAPVRTIAFGTEPEPGPPRDQSTPLVNNAAWAGYGAIREPAHIHDVRWRAPISTVVEARTARPRTALPIAGRALIIAAPGAPIRATVPAHC